MKGNNQRPCRTVNVTISNQEPKIFNLLCLISRKEDKKNKEAIGEGEEEEEKESRRRRRRRRRRGRKRRRRAANTGFSKYLSFDR